MPRLMIERRQALSLGQTKASGSQHRFARPSLSLTGVLTALAALLLLVVAGLALWSNWGTRGNLDALRRSSAVQSSALTFLSRLQDAETGQRGFLLTEDPVFLEPYERAVASLPADLDRLRTSVGNDADQRARVTGLAVLLPRKVRELADTVELVRQQRRQDAVAVVSAASGKATMDDIRRVITRILEDDDEGLIEREGTLDQRGRLFTTGVATAAILALGSMTLVFIQVRRQFRAADQLRHALAAMNSTLEREVAHRTREAEVAMGDAVVARERAESERARVELLLQDVNHRIGNNLAMVSGMLGLQVSASDDDVVRSQLRAAQTRIGAIANAQRRLRLGADLSTVRADETIENALADLRATLGDEQDIRIETRLSPLVVESRDAVHLAVLVNELATNAVKHAFPKRDEGCITVELATDAAGVPILVVRDDGCGMPSEATNSGSLGHKLIASLSRQFGGKPETMDAAGGGTRVSVRMPGLELKRT